jgi:hypothetical protein
MELQEEIRLARHEAMIGEVLEVLVDGVSDESEFLLDARHEGQAPGIDGKVILTDGSRRARQLRAGPRHPGRRPRPDRHARAVGCPARRSVATCVHAHAPPVIFSPESSRA